MRSETAPRTPTHALNPHTERCARARTRARAPLAHAHHSRIRKRKLAHIHSLLRTLLTHIAYSHFSHMHKFDTCTARTTRQWHDISTHPRTRSRSHAHMYKLYTCSHTPLTYTRTHSLARTLAYSHTHARTITQTCTARAIVRTFMDARTRAHSHPQALSHPST